MRLTKHINEARVGDGHFTKFIFNSSSPMPRSATWLRQLSGQIVYLNKKYQLIEFIQGSNKRTPSKITVA